MAEQGNVDAAITAYEEKYGKLPDDLNSLLVFTAKKPAGVPVRLTKTKHAKLIEKTLKKRKKAGGSGASGATGKKKPAKKPAAAAAESEAKSPTASEEAPAKKYVAPKQDYPLDSIVLLSGDRIGVVRWFGAIPSRKNHYFYGVELLGAVAGSSDGMVDGVRYFKTAPDRAKFFPPTKIRKIANEKDQTRVLGHERSESWIARNASELAASTGAVSPDLAAVDEDADETKADEDAGVALAEAEPSGDDGSADEEVKEDGPGSSTPSASGRHKRSGTVVEMMDVEGASRRESPLEFILRQSGDTRDLLLDIFCSPKMHDLFMSSFNQVKSLEQDEQPEVWKELMARWRLKMN